MKAFQILAIPRMHVPIDHNGQAAIFICSDSKNISTTKQIIFRCGSYICLPNCFCLLLIFTLWYDANTSDPYRHALRTEDRENR